VDIFKSPALSLGHKNYDMVGNGLCEILDRPELDRAVFEIDRDEGVHLDMTFLDKQGRVIELQIKEPKLPPPSWHSFLSRSPRMPFALLAPLGSGTKSPPSLPLIFLYDFYFVRKQGTIICIVVDGRNHEPDDLPIRVDGHAVSFVRYSSDPFAMTMNDRKHNGVLPPITTPFQGGIVEGINNETHSMFYEFTPDGDKKVGMKSMKVWTTKHALKLSFSPPFPDVKGFGATEAKGEFTLESDWSSGSVSGSYCILGKSSSEAQIELRPLGGWKPRETKWSVLLTYWMIPLIKRWPKTYVWTANVTTDETTGIVKMISEWTRNELPKGFHDMSR
jgi:hypothetical protein